MKKFLICLVLSGCGPLSLSADVNWGIGGNQKFKKTVEVEQVQTDAQIQSQTDIAEAIVKVIPLLKAEPTPTPTPPVLKSLTLEFVGPPEPPIVVEKTYSSKAKPRKKSKTTIIACPQINNCEAGLNQNCLYKEGNLYCNTME